MNRLYLIFILFIFASCTVAHRYINAPIPPSAVYISEKGETQFTSTFSVNPFQQNGNKNAGIDLQGAVAVVDNVIVNADYSYKHEKDWGRVPATVGFPSGGATINYDRNYFEIGGGYVFQLDKEKTTRINLLLGYHSDNNKWNEDGKQFSEMSQNGIDSIIYRRFFNGRKTGFYIQPSVSYISKDGSFKGSFILKGSLLRLKSPVTDYTEDEAHYYNYNSLIDKNIGNLETSLNFTFKLSKAPWLYGTFSTGFLFPSYQRKLETSNFYSRSIPISLGFTFFPGALMNKN